ncbi:FCD domain-containing protein [Algirhabdus cladophorae]|uniref:FCD domain-containing protein n=1 Tax=Algirhabdus cladophorae TaxID=3377108 RepID=UPI003B84A676
MRSLSIKIPNVSESLETKLEALILGGAFWPDIPIAAERRLAKEFDVSRTSLRNALSSLLQRGLLTQIGKRYFATNIMADLLGPGLTQIAEDDPMFLLNYWVLLFEDALGLANKKAQDSDRALIKDAATALKKTLLGPDVAALSNSFASLSRTVFDSCYNFFLSQTHHSLIKAMQPQIRASLALMLSNPETKQAFLQSVTALSHGDFERTDFHAALAKGFVRSDVQTTYVRPDVQTVNATPLVDVVLRNPLFLEAVYELRLITERHAAVEAAEHADSNQHKQLLAHLDYMTAIADSAPSQYSKLDTELHQLIAECTQNPVFSVVDAALGPVFSGTTNQWLKKHRELRSDQSAIHVQHTQIVKAIVAQDLERAHTTMNEHLAYVLRNLRYLREQDQLHEIALARRLLRQ